MARCESIDFLRQIILNNKVIKIESSDSDLESDVSNCIELDSEIIIDNTYEPDSSENVNKEQGNSGQVLSLNFLHDESIDQENFTQRHTAGEEEHPHLETLISNDGPIVYSVSSVHQHSSIPARNNWDGPHNFKIKISCDKMPRKTESPIFSEAQNKLYISKDHPFKVLVNAENVPIGSVINVTAAFSMVEHSYEVVRRCPTHAQQDYTKGIAAFEHFVQSFSDGAIYEKEHKTGRLGVSVSYEKPQEGETYSSYLFKLTCFSSCCGGINRRPFMLIFTLKKENRILGRQTIDAKVCACPLRDLRLESARNARKADKVNISRTKTVNTSNISSSESSSDSDPDSPETISPKYSIIVSDYKLYLFLQHMKNLYETGTHSSLVTSDT